MHFCVLQVICELVQPFRKISPTVVRISVFEGDPHQSPGACPSLRSWAGLAEDKSYDVDGDDELLPELVNNTGTTRGTKLSVLHEIVISSVVNLGHWNIRGPRRVLQAREQQAFLRVIALSRRD